MQLSYRRKQTSLFSSTVVNGKLTLGLYAPKSDLTPRSCITQSLRSRSLLLLTTLLSIFVATSSEEGCRIYV